VIRIGSSDDVVFGRQLHDTLFFLFICSSFVDNFAGSIEVVRRDAVSRVFQSTTTNSRAGIPFSPPGPKSARTMPHAEREGSMERI
jgi:hypothetical protein